MRNPRRGKGVKQTAVYSITQRSAEAALMAKKPLKPKSRKNLHSAASAWYFQITDIQFMAVA